MHYVHKTDQGIHVKDAAGERTLNKGLLQYLNEQLIARLSTYDGRMRAVKTITGKKRHVPILIDEACCLYTTDALRSPFVACINYHAVLSVRRHESGTATVWFKDLTALNTTVPYETLAKRHARTGAFLRTLRQTLQQESVFSEAARMDFMHDI